MGNLTLITGSLNSSVSNGPWGSKRQGLSEHSNLMLNAEFKNQIAWDEASIDERGRRLAALACQVWWRPEPETQSSESAPMGKKPPRSESRGQKDVERIFRRLGLPTTASVEAVIGMVAGALPHDVLDAFDDAEGNESKRLAMVYSNALNALWLGAGLRAPMLYAQLPWIIDRLRDHGITRDSTVLDLGSGSGLTAVTIQSILGCQVTGVDPQPGSAAAGDYLNDRIGTAVQFVEHYPHEYLSISGTFDAVVAQAVLAYTQPQPCRDPEPGGAAFRRGLEDPTPPTADTLALIQVGATAKCLLVLDHDQPSLWGYLAQHAGRNGGLAPRWETLAIESFLLPLGQDTQIAMAFERGAWSEVDLEQLVAVLEAGESGVSREPQTRTSPSHRGVSERLNQHRDEPV